MKRFRIIMNDESFQGFVIFNSRVKPKFYEFISKLTKIVFIIWIEQQKKVFYAGYRFFQFEILLCHIQLICQFFKFSDRILCLLKH